MAGALRDQALSLLAAVNNNGNLTVKLSSFRQFREILSSVDPSLASELFPCLVELQSSSESLVRKLLIEVMEDVGLKAMEQSSILMPVLLDLLKDSDSIVSKQAIVSGTSFFCNILEEMALQFHRFGKVERWLEELWTWMLKFKDAVFGIALEPGTVGARMLAMKFLETFVLLFSADANDIEKSIAEGNGHAFNISWILGGHPVLDQLTFTSEVHRTIGILLNLLQSAGDFPGCLTITVVSCCGFPFSQITDACSACFEQRTVFTQQVLARALNQMVDQVPLPLLFMRTVIQAIDAFPTLVDFVMEILSKLVRKQVWRMPKLWVGFLKCVFQTQPHSFHVLLQLPPPQLESALNKYSNLRGPLAAFASQLAVRNSLPRSALVVLGLANESHVQQSYLSSSLHASEMGSSVHGATLT